MPNRLSGSIAALLLGSAATLAFAAGNEHTFNIARQPINLSVPDGWGTSFHMMGRQLIILGPLHDGRSQITIGVERLTGPAPKESGEKSSEHTYIVSCKNKKDVTFRLRVLIPQAAASDADTATGIVKSFACR